jgi:chaperonin GroES
MAEENVIPIKASPFLENKAKGLDKEELKEIGDAVVEDFKTDKASREGWDERIEEWYKLFSGLTDKKDFPWPDASNINIPLMSTACLQFQARSYDSLLGSSKEIAKCFSTDGNTMDAAERCQLFMNWQLTEQMEEWEDDMDVLLLLIPIYGVAVKKTFYDASLKRVVSRALRVDEFVAHYGAKRLEDADRMTHVYEISRNDIKIKGKEEIWENTEQIEDILADRATAKMAEPHKIKEDENSGTEDSLEAKDIPRSILEQHRLWDLDGDGIEEPYIITVDEDTATVLRIEDLQFNYFTAYSLIPNPNSWMGFGFGHLLEHLNQSANSLINQLTDAGTLNNLSTGFFNKRSGLKTGDLEMELGKYVGVDLSTDDINKAIYQFKFQQPSNTLFALLQMTISMSRELASVSETMLGNMPPSDTTATSMLAVMEQGLKVFSTINKRQYRSLKKELKKIARLNSVFLDEQVYFAVQNSTSSEIQTLKSGRADFANNIDVIPVADPSITSRAEKLIKATKAYEIVRQDPQTGGDPKVLREALKNYLEANEVPDVEALLPQPVEPPDLRPEEEEAEFIKEQGVQPLPQQDHMAHLQSHQIFLESPTWSGVLTPQGKKLLEAHMRETYALLYVAQGAVQ